MKSKGSIPEVCHEFRCSVGVGHLSLHSAMPSTICPRNCQIQIQSSYCWTVSTFWSNETTNLIHLWTGLWTGWSLHPSAQYSLASCQETTPPKLVMFCGHLLILSRLYLHNIPLCHAQSYCASRIQHLKGCNCPRLSTCLHKSLSIESIAHM